MSLSSSTQVSNVTTIPLLVAEEQGVPRQKEAVTVGIPFPKGAIREPSELILRDPQDRRIPLQTQELERWADQSCKWVLLDFQANVAANSTVKYRIEYGDIDNASLEFSSNLTAISVRHEDTGLIVDTGAAAFILNTTTFAPFEQVLIGDTSVLDRAKSRIVLLDESGQNHQHVIDRLVIETEGMLRTTLKVEGQILRGHQTAFARFFARLHFYADSTLCKIDYTIHNPNAAKHPGGVWDLGDEGSIYFQDLALHFAPASNGPAAVNWATRPDAPLVGCDADSLTIYQDSSGGEQWQSVNHINRYGKVMHSFCGYRVTADAVLEEGLRATPTLSIRTGLSCINGAIRQFWQNFPKALEAREQTLIINLFPKHYQDLYELQGGEQKTHNIFISFAAAPFSLEAEKQTLHWIDTPLILHALPEWFAASKAIDYLVPLSQEPHPEIAVLINQAIEGENTFFDRREQIDEYGWRHFGDLYADHEKVFYTGKAPHISHYNNQYDCIYGMLLQYLRSGRAEWFRLLHDLAHHVVDIDIYHTNQDKTAYSGGFFWHTDHYRTAGTATHRGFSKMTMLEEGLSYYGGGPGSEHNYTTGLLHHYYLTGETASKEAVLGLADWVITMDDGAKTPFRFLNQRPTGHASTSDTPEYHGPGRGAGYSINALLDAYLVSRESKYLNKADELIGRCIHPADDIEQHDLGNTEDRWFYIVFLQILGRYLDFKMERKELDFIYCYARESLLHYARWMSAHEVLFSTLFEKLEYPTETWPAQDLRKSNVFRLAAKYAPEALRQEFLRKADEFFENSLRDLFSFETKNLTRPLILLMINTPIEAYWQQHPGEHAPDVSCQHDFGQPQRFKPQLYMLHKIRALVSTLSGRIKSVLRQGA